MSVTNRRIGYVDLTVKKEWADNNANPEDRPEATFVITETSDWVTFLEDESGNISAKLGNGNTLPLFKDSENDTEDSDRERFTGEVRNNDKELLITVDAQVSGEGNLTYRINGLPKYDGQGKVASYEIKEEMENATTSEGDKYVTSSSVTQYNVDELHFHDTQEYTFKNLLTGTKNVVFHKVWKDAYVNEVLKQRPDIYLTLYTLGENGIPQEVTDFVSITMDEDPDHGETNHNDITIPNLPKYDKNGKEITYYATENVSADAKSLDYTDVVLTKPDGFQGDNAFVEIPQVSSDEPSGENVAENDESKTGSDWAVIENGTFTNALKGTATIEGIKLWQNVPGDFPLEELPWITIYVQQKAPDDSWDDKDLSVVSIPAGADGSDYAQIGDTGKYVEGAIAWATLTPSKDNPTNEWQYSITKKGNNEQAAIENPGGTAGGDEQTGAVDEADALPKYDEDGNLYEYRTREAVWGVLGTEGGFSFEDLGDTTVSGAEGTVEEAVKNLYSIQHGIGSSFMLSNAYQSLKGELSVKKVFSGNRVEDDHYPNVTFRLYRQYQMGEDDEGNPTYSAPSQVAQHTILASEFENATAADGPFTYTFENLDVYAPNGYKWRYFVAEAPIDGYETTVGVGDLSSEQVMGEGQQYTDSDGAIMDIGTASAVQVLTPKEVDESNNVAANPVVVTFKNTYDPDSELSLSGEKIWDDYSGIFGGIRNDQNVQLSLKRVSGSGQEEDLGVVKGTGNDSLYPWDINSILDGNVWKYTITDLERWAPDGTPWTYYVTESMNGDGSYRVIDGEAHATAPSEGNGSFTKLHNGLKAKLTVKKVWYDEGNDWGQRPSSVYVHLMAKVEGGSWGDAYQVLNDLADQSGAIDGFVALQNATMDQRLYSGNGWSYTWESLPAKVGGQNHLIPSG